ncbi:polyprenol phosphomannose-dependent alpha 1,6 mannosyltransferase MptB [Corynebacterium sp. ES2715-CONJ3]|uniref:polyprenol phosphomannose-dependent alpha 1,6 mannosyltransferase MptB n=1 Tax=Corynebacterium sp. ES2715-CONJ3 TaxID=2974028 RepID=UPI0037C0EF1A
MLRIQSIPPSLQTESGERYHDTSLLVKATSGVDLIKTLRDGSVTLIGDSTEAETEPTVRDRIHTPLTAIDLERFAFTRWMGTLGSLLLSLGALGAGALPVVNSPYTVFPGGTLMARMLQASTVLCFVGIALLVLAWLFMAPFAGVALKEAHTRMGLISMSMTRRTFVAWSLPLIASAPMFTQDIYSYLANGAIVVMGLDPYSAGPVDLLGTDNDLARSVPFIWAHSPSPYGPVALGIAALISFLTNDSIVLGVLAHRIISLLGVALAGWALTHLAKRCGVLPQAALWLGILNPLTILHLIGGIHNESILLGLLMAGIEVGLRGVDYMERSGSRRAVILLATSGLLISLAGMVKVTGFIGLGFIGMAIARVIHLRGRSTPSAWLIAVALQTFCMIAAILTVTWVSGIGSGWITGQGGAIAVRSWMSISTALGVIFGFVGKFLYLGDHTEAILIITRLSGLAVAGFAMVRLLLRTYQGAIHPVGALGISTLVMVAFFPVVHPWYMLWAILPLAAWANREVFRAAVIAYTLLLSFFVLPRGLSLPPETVLSIYTASVVGLVVIISLMYVSYRRNFKRRID